MRFSWESIFTIIDKRASSRGDGCGSDCDDKDGDAAAAYADDDDEDNYMMIILQSCG